MPQQTSVNPGDYTPSPLRSFVSRSRRRIGRLVKPRNFKETYAIEALKPREDCTYVEIGVRHGDSFRAIKADLKVAIDPIRTSGMKTLRSNETFFQSDSDTFFRQHANHALMGRKVDVALVDGLHTFAQAYKDVYHLKSFMQSDGRIILDDCNPPTARRGAPSPVDGLWNGDVWKIFELLSPVIGPDSLYVIDADQGIGIISDFSREWPAPESSEFRRAAALPYEYLEERRSDVLRLRSP